MGGLATYVDMPPGEVDAERGRITPWGQAGGSTDEALLFSWELELSSLRVLAVAPAVTRVTATTVAMNTNQGSSGGKTRAGVELRTLKWGMR